MRNFKVSNTQDALVSIMDYYEPSKCVLEFLILQKLSQTFIHSFIHSWPPISCVGRVVGESIGGGV